jgi:hypothetical protein
MEAKMDLIEIGAVGMVAVFVLVVLGKLLHAADKVAEAIRDATIIGGSPFDAPREDPSAPPTIAHLFGKRIPS